MTEGIVQGFEIIDVDVRNRQGMGIAARPLDLEIGALVECKYVRRARQRVCPGILSFPLEQSFDIGEHVCHDQEETQSHEGVPVRY